MERDQDEKTVVVSKSSRTVINVAQKLENAVQPVYHVTVKTTQNIVEIPTVQEQMTTGIPKVHVVQCSTPIRSCLFSLLIALHVAQLVPLSV